MVKKYVVKLTQKERECLRPIVSRGGASRLMRLHARILLKADSSRRGQSWTDEQIAEALEVHVRTVARVRERFVQEGLDGALQRKPQSRRKPRIIHGEAEAHLIALACSDPPEGHVRWSLRLLSDKLVELKHVDSVCRETVRKTLKKML